MGNGVINKWQSYSVCIQGSIIPGSGLRNFINEGFLTLNQPKLNTHGIPPWCRETMGKF